MKWIRRILLLGVLVLTLSMAASAAGVTSTTASIGGATAQVVYVTLSDTSNVAPVLANNSVGTDAAADAIISGAPGQVAAAVNGNFFNSYYDPSKPLAPSTGNYPRIFSTLVVDGEMICSGSHVGLGFGYDGSAVIGRVDVIPIVRVGGYPYGAWGVNTLYTDSRAVFVLTDEFDYAVDLTGFSAVVIRDGKVELIEKDPAGFVTPDGAYTLVVGDGYGLRKTKAGDTVTYSLTDRNESGSSWETMRNIIGGGGMIVENGAVAVDDNAHITAEDQNPDLSAQRAFAAVLSDGRLMFGTVYSSYRAIAKSLVEMGVTDAMSLDGGASSMLYANGSYPTKAGRKLASILAVIDGTVTAASTSNAPVLPSAWAKEDVDSAREKGILPENLDGAYQQSITRGEFCQLISGYLTAKEGKTAAALCKSRNVKVDAGLFSDTDDEETAAIAALGIVTGYPDGSFKPDGKILRQDAAIMLQRLAECLGKDTAGTAKQFTDEKQISAYARPGVDFVTGLGVMNGHSSGKFAPRDNITREQAVITIMNVWRIF